MKGKLNPNETIYRAIREDVRARSEAIRII